MSYIANSKDVTARTRFSCIRQLICSHTKGEFKLAGSRGMFFNHQLENRRLHARQFLASTMRISTDGCNTHSQRDTHMDTHITGKIGMGISNLGDTHNFMAVSLLVHFIRAIKIIIRDFVVLCKFVLVHQTVGDHLLVVSRTIRDTSLCFRRRW